MTCIIMSLRKFRYDSALNYPSNSSFEEDLVENLESTSVHGDEVTFSADSIAHNDTIKDNLSVDAIVICRQQIFLLMLPELKVVGLKHADYDFNGRESKAYK